MDNNLLNNDSSLDYPLLPETFRATDWSSLIDDFQVICIYHNKNFFSNDIVSRINQDIPPHIATMNVYNNYNYCTTYIIWDHTYEESKDIFVELRYAARNDLIQRITVNIVFYVLKKYEEYSGKPVKSNPKLKRKEHFQSILDKVYNELKNSTFLKEDLVWEEFCEWFKEHLTAWTLFDMETAIGKEILNKMDSTIINDLFIKYLSKNCKENTGFIKKFTEIINNYTKEWMEKIIAIMDLESMPHERIASILQIEPEQVLHQTTFNKILHSHRFSEGNLLVMSNPIYQTIREALTLKKFDINSSSKWPETKLQKGQLEGMLRIVPVILSEKDEDTYDYAAKQAGKITDLDVDIIDALCAHYFNQSRYKDDIVETSIDYLLSLRGLKEKLSGNGRRGGYEKSQRREVLNALTRIQSIWIEVKRITTYSNGKPEQVSLNGRPFLFLNKNNKEYNMDEKIVDEHFTYRIGNIFEDFLIGSGRQLALLPIKTLQYNPYTERIEKRLIRYLSWRWRTQARRADYHRPHKIKTLLEMIGHDLNKRVPSRSRDRMEEALDRLQQDGLIGSWHYEKWEEEFASYKGWGEIWKDSTLQIMPPTHIKEKYRSIELKKNQQPQEELLLKQPKGEAGLIGEKVRNTRRKLRLNLTQVSSEIEISPSYLSNIERGISIPSNKVQRLLINWLQRHSM